MGAQTNSDKNIKGMETSKSIWEADVEISARQMQWIFSTQEILCESCCWLNKQMHHQLQTFGSICFPAPGELCLCFPSDDSTSQVSVARAQWLKPASTGTKAIAQIGIQKRNFSLFPKKEQHLDKF